MPSPCPRTLLSLGLAFAAVCAPATAAISIDTVFVGDAGNAADSSGYGDVSYDYYIGTYEVSNAQYASFLNAVAATDAYGLYHTDMSLNGLNRSGSSGSYTYSVSVGSEAKPVIRVGFWDAARFANWMTSGNTEVGVYMLGGVANPSNATVTRDATAWANGGWALPTEDEWYKAAYYDPSVSGPGDDYWAYATRSDSAPNAAAANGSDANSANYNSFVGGTTTVGGYSIATSYYGTYDQGGNVREWQDDITFTSYRSIRGGSYSDDGTHLVATDRHGYNPTYTADNVGFRLVTLSAVPEVSALPLLLGLAGWGAIALRRRR